MLRRHHLEPILIHNNLLERTCQIPTLLLDKSSSSLSLWHLILFYLCFFFLFAAIIFGFILVYIATCLLCKRPSFGHSLWTWLWFGNTSRGLLFLTCQVMTIKTCYVEISYISIVSIFMIFHLYGIVFLRSTILISFPISSIISNRSSHSNFKLNQMYTVSGNKWDGCRKSSNFKQSVTEKPSVNTPLNPMLYIYIFSLSLFIDIYCVDSFHTDFLRSLWVFQVSWWIQLGCILKCKLGDSVTYLLQLTEGCLLPYLSTSHVG